MGTTMRKDGYTVVNLQSGLSRKEANLLSGRGSLPRLMDKDIFFVPGGSDKYLLGELTKYLNGIAQEKENAQKFLRGVLIRKNGSQEFYEVPVDWVQGRHVSSDATAEVAVSEKSGNMYVATHRCGRVDVRESLISLEEGDMFLKEDLFLEWTGEEVECYSKETFFITHKEASDGTWVWKDDYSTEGAVVPLTKVTERVLRKVTNQRRIPKAEALEKARKEVADRVAKAKR